MNIKTYAVLITAENSDTINKIVARYELNVEVQYDMEEAADFGTTTYAILSINYTTKQATFTTMWSDDFGSYWHFCNGEILHDTFHQITNV